MRSLKDMLARVFLGRGWSGWPGPEERTAGAPSPPPQAEGKREEYDADERSGEADQGRAGEGGLPPLKPDWRDIVAFTIAMYQILAVPFLLFCGVALFIYFLLWLWAR